MTNLISVLPSNDFNEEAQKIGSIGNFQKNEDFRTKSRYLLKISRALHIESQKKNWQSQKKKNWQKIG